MSARACSLTVPIALVFLLDEIRQASHAGTAAHQGQNCAAPVAKIARRCSRDTATLDAWITWASMPRALSQRANQKPSRPASNATAIRSILRPAFSASSRQRLRSINSGVKTVDSIFHTTGGMIADGVALYNYFRAVPIDLHLYNIGSVSSIGVIAFLGARHRYASANATFVVHKSHYAPNTPTDANRASGMADALKIEDTRTQAILEANLTISLDQLNKHLLTEFPFDAKSALGCGLIQEIREFAVPAGGMLNNI
jgi:ATP-dependent Clp protease, protease subunit